MYRILALALTLLCFGAFPPSPLDNPGPGTAPGKPADIEAHHFGDHDEAPDSHVVHYGQVIHWNDHTSHGLDDLTFDDGFCQSGQHPDHQHRCVVALRDGKEHFYGYANHPLAQGFSAAAPSVTHCNGCFFVPQP